MKEEKIVRNYADALIIKPHRGSAKHGDEVFHSQFLDNKVVLTNY